MRNVEVKQQQQRKIINFILVGLHQKHVTVARVNTE